MSRTRNDVGDIDPGGPIDPGDPIDVDPIKLYELQFAALDPALPLALLPVRIETRFIGRPRPTELLVRVYPDLIHADGHDRGLTAAEGDLGRAFWRRCWRSGGDDAEQDAAFAWLADQTGPWRAAWIASETKPRNHGQAPTEPVPDGEPLDPRPLFEELELSEGAVPVYARLLPHRWVVSLYGDSEQALGTWYGELVDTELAMAPGLSAAAGDVDGKGLLDTQGLGWVHDPDEAERLGMLVRIDLSDLPTTRFGALTVFGLNTTVDENDLEELLAAHRYTNGLDLVPQGTPTNATETAGPGLHLNRPDLSELRTSELEPATPVERPDVSEDGDLFRMSAADGLSVALGLRGPNALDRARHGAITELADAEAMNRALWGATLGHYFSSVLGGVLADEDRDWLRDWASTFVRGGGQLPTLLIGPQPYGVIPVAWNDPSLSENNNIGMVEDVVNTLSTAHWGKALPFVPHLDHNLTDADPGQDNDGSLAATVSQVFGSVPHPTALRLRGVDAMRDTYTESYGGYILGLGLQVLGYPDEDGNPLLTSDDNISYGEYQRLLDRLQYNLTAEGQSDDWSDSAFWYRNTSAVIIDDVRHELTTEQRAFNEELAQYIEDGPVPLIDAHAERVRPVRTAVGLNSTNETGLMGDEDDPHAYYNFHDPQGTETTWHAPLVADGVSADDVAALDDFIAQLRDRVADGQGSTGGYEVERPLLQHLLNRSADRAGSDDDRTLLLAGLDGLRDVLAADPLPIETLERLLRESLGRTGNRLDAWYSAVAAWRLDNKRANNRAGLHIGAYGFVVDLRRRAGRASEGHILAPSLSHATTAAVMRSGWAAFGSQAQTSGLAVDLSSDRIRRARWLIDGVRRGQPLAELLGGRFERRLHDEVLDRWVKPFRQLALEAVGDTSPPNAPVDGLLLARGWGGGDELTTAEQYIADNIKAWLAAPDRPGGDPTAVLDSLVADLDATADAAAAQSVFSLVEGNVPEATAALTGSSSGEIEFPHLRFADSPRTAATISHRLIAVIDPDGRSTWPGATTGGRALASPAVEAWAAELLGDPRTLPFTVTFVDPDGPVVHGQPIDGTVADLGLSALDFVFLCPTGEEQGLGRLDGVLRAWAELHRPQGADGADAVIAVDRGEPALVDMVIAGRALRAMLGAANDLDARSLSPAGATDVPGGVDTRDTGTRVRAVAEALEAVAAELETAMAGGDVATIRAAMLATVGFDLAAGIPADRDSDRLLAKADRLARQITDRLAAFAAGRPSPTEPAPFDPDTVLGVMADRLSLLVGHRLPLAPRFEAVNGDELAASFKRRRPSGPAVVAGWLAAAGRVEPGPERLRVAVDLVEAASGRPRFDFSVAQLPDHPREGWVATSRPTADGRGRLNIVATGEQPEPDRPMSGLVLGTWTEPIAAPRQTPGLAFHFDGPSSRAPQAVLLCVAKPDSGYSVDYVRAVIRQTLEMAKMRMVGLETLQELGQYAPAVYLPDTLNPGSAA